MQWSATGRRLVCLWGAALCLAASSAAAAPRRPRVVVVPLASAPGVPPETAVRLGELLEARLLAEDSLEWGALGGLFGPTPATEVEVGRVLEASTGARLHQAMRDVDAHFALVGFLAPAQAGHVTVGLALYSARARGFAPLPTLQLAGAPQQAQAEATVEAVVARVRNFGAPLPLPHPLVATPGALLVPREEPAPVAASLAPANGAAAPRPASAPDTVRSGLPWWVWAAGGVGVAVVAGGIAYGVSQAARPPSGTLAVRW